MKNGRNVATLAAVLGVIAPLAVAAQAARADELADLRANQELLQRRLDQLAQAKVPGNMFGVGGPPGPVNTQMMGGSFPRSFLVPGTDTSIRVGGRVTTIADYWFDGGPPQANQNTTVGNNGQALSIPLKLPGGNFQRSRGTGVFQISARESAVNIETRTPTAYGEARTFIEWDFAQGNIVNGSNLAHVADNWGLRLRFAYGTLGGFLAGQANSNFADPDAGSETIDFGGNVGNAGVVRLPQVRYTTPLAAWGLPGAVSVSAEVPATDFWSPAAGNSESDNNGVAFSAAPGFPAKAGAPDLTAAYYVPQPWGHFDVAAVVRPTLTMKDGLAVDRNFIGYGFAFGMDVKPGWFGWQRDDITLRGVGGWAIGRYDNSGSNFALVTNYPATTPVAAGVAPFVGIKPVVNFGVEAGYRHNWLPNLRSTISVGLLHNDIPTGIPNIAGGVPNPTTPSGVCPSTSAKTAGSGCGLNKEVMTAHVNLIWNPVAFADFGIEYVWGHRVTVSNQRGDENTLIGRFRVNF